MAKKKWVITKRWLALSRDAQVEEVRQAMASGLSNTGAAAELGTTPGTVAGIRYKEGIPSQNPPMIPAKKVLKDKLPLKLAASEATQCDYTYKDEHRCGYEKAPSSERCALHQKEQYKQKK